MQQGGCGHPPVQRDFIRERKIKMKKESNKKMMLILMIIFILIVVVGIMSTQNLNKSSTEKSFDKAMSYLENYLKGIHVKEADLVKSTVSFGDTKLEDELPDISDYPLSVEGKGEVNIEIFSSPEKAGEDRDGWLNEVANRFNRSNKTVNGKKVSVSIRSIASGAAVDYIASGKYVPDGFTPSNELWAEMLQAQKVELKKVSDGIAKNATGMLLSSSTYDALQQKYGTVDLGAVVQATINNEIAMGYTNPYASSTGMNFLISTLTYFDQESPLSSTAISGFQKFQSNIPFVSYTTMQMRGAAESGSLDAFILEYQTYSNDATLKRDYTFIPFGVRHDSPMYVVGNLEDEKSQVLDLFTTYCLSNETQKLATDYGFNNNADYVPQANPYDGKTLTSAQDLWKKEKDLGKPIIAVFVTDVSGSMAGEPLARLKQSLRNSMQYINSNNQIGLVSYSTDVTINLPINEFNLNQKAYFNGALDGLYANGKTATFDAIIVAANMLVKKQQEVADSKMMMFVLSDGDTNTGHSIEEASNVIQNLDIPIYTIGYNADIEALDKISSINEAANINADSDDVIYQLKNLFNSNL